MQSVGSPLSCAPAELRADAISSSSPASFPSTFRTQPPEVHKAGDVLFLQVFRALAMMCKATEVLQSWFL